MNDHNCLEEVQNCFELKDKTLIYPFWNSPSPRHNQGFKSVVNEMLKAKAARPVTFSWFFPVVIAMKKTGGLFSGSISGFWIEKHCRWHIRKVEEVFTMFVGMSCFQRIRTFVRILGNTDGPILQEVYDSCHSYRLRSVLDDVIWLDKQAIYILEINEWGAEENLLSVDILERLCRSMKRNERVYSLLETGYCGNKCEATAVKIYMYRFSKEKVELIGYIKSSEDVTGN